MDHLDVKTRRLDGPNRGFSPRPRPPNTKVDLFHTHFLDRDSTLLSSPLSRKRRALATTFVAHGAACLPGQSLPVLVGNRHERVIKGRLDMDDPFNDVLPDFLLCHFSPLLIRIRHPKRQRENTRQNYICLTLFLVATTFRGPFLVREFVFVLWPRTGRPLL